MLEFAHIYAKIIKMRKFFLEVIDCSTYLLTFFLVGNKST